MIFVLFFVGISSGLLWVRAGEHHTKIDCARRCRCTHSFSNCEHVQHFLCFGVALFSVVLFGESRTHNAGRTQATMDYAMQTYLAPPDMFAVCLRLASNLLASSLSFGGRWFARAAALAHSDRLARHCECVSPNG